MRTLGLCWNNLLGLIFIYLEGILTAAFAHRLGSRPGLVLGAILGCAGLVLLSPYVEGETQLQLTVASSLVAFSALSLGFGSVGRIPTRSLYRLGVDLSDWRVALTELNEDDRDPNATLSRVASTLGPMVPRRIGILREYEATT